MVPRTQQSALIFDCLWGGSKGVETLQGIQFGKTTGSLAKAFQAWQKLSEAAGHEEAETVTRHLSRANLGVPDPLIYLIGTIGNHSSPTPLCYISPLVQHL